MQVKDNKEMIIEEVNELLLLCVGKECVHMQKIFHPILRVPSILQSEILQLRGQGGLIILGIHNEPGRVSKGKYEFNGLAKEFYVENVINAIPDKKGVIIHNSMVENKWLYVIEVIALGFLSDFTY